MIANFINGLLPSEASELIINIMFEKGLDREKVIEISKIKAVSAQFMSKAEERHEKYLIEELRKLIFAANISGQKRNEYIYNASYKYMNEMEEEYEK